MDPVPEVDPVDALKALIASPNYCSRAWIYEQYDYTVMADTIRTPGLGAGIVRVHGTDKALAFTSDVTPRYVRANPVEGGKQAVAEAFRNLCAVGARPLATTDNLNFGNPEKPEIMGQFVGAIKGIGAACTALDMPIVSGNVSLYNETDGQAILPTPTIGAVGLLDTSDEMIADTIREGHVLLLVGETQGHLGQSAFCGRSSTARTATRRMSTSTAERRNGDFIRENAEWINACTDLSDGGLALAAFEMAVAGDVGVTLEAADTADALRRGSGPLPDRHQLRQGRGADGRGGQAGVPMVTVGRVGGDMVKLGGRRRRWPSSGRSGRAPSRGISDERSRHRQSRLLERHGGGLGRGGRTGLGLRPGHLGQLERAGGGAAPLPEDMTGHGRDRAGLRHGLCLGLDGAAGRAGDGHRRLRRAAGDRAAAQRRTRARHHLPGGQCGGHGPARRRLRFRHFRIRRGDLVRPGPLAARGAPPAPARRDAGVPRQPPDGHHHHAA
jgi:selenophosphate synthetase-related protein